MIFSDPDFGGAPSAPTTGSATTDAVNCALIAAFSDLRFIEARCEALHCLDALKTATADELPGLMPQLEAARQASMIAQARVDDHIAAAEAEHGGNFMLVLLREVFQQAECAQRVRIDVHAIATTLRAEWPHVYTAIFGEEGWSMPIDAHAELLAERRAI